VVAARIIVREIFVSGLREYLGNRQIKMPVSKLAKWKTASQFFAIGFLICGQSGPAPAQSGLYGEVLRDFYVSGVALLGLSAVLTLITGCQYMRKAFEHMRK
jgi:phosphatidylglycerophosphate synthase